MYLSLFSLLLCSNCIFVDFRVFVRRPARERKCFERELGAICSGVELLPLCVLWGEERRGEERPLIPLTLLNTFSLSPLFHGKRLL